MRYGPIIRVAVAIACGVWFVGFGWKDPHTGLVALPLVIAGAALLPAHVRWSAALMVVAGYVTLLFGAGWGNVELVLPMALVLFALGRADDQTWFGISAVTLAAVAAALRGGFEPEKLAMIAGVYGTMWLFGVIVRRRALGALAARRRASDLAQQNPQAIGRRLAIAERSQVADKTIFAIRASISNMRTAARAATPDLAGDDVRAVHACGVQAVEELGSFLGLLREPGPDAPESESDRPPITRSRWLWDAALVVIGSVILGVVMMQDTSPDVSGGVLALYIGAGVAVAIRRIVPVWACLIAFAATVAAVIDPPANADLLLPAALAYALITWVVVGDTIRRAWPSLAALTLAAIAVAVNYGARGVAFILLVFGSAALAGYAWHERDRILRAAATESDGLQARLHAATAQALQDERLQLARELHDVASHSVGAMVMQASAACALFERNPDEARAALTTVVATADSVLTGIESLSEAMNSAEFGPLWYPYSDTDDLRPTLERLIADMRAMFTMDVRVALADLPGDPRLAATTFRIIQEGLANAARHAPGAAVQVSVAREPDAYRVRVSDEGTAVSGTPGTGFGLAGLRERVQDCAGHLRAEPIGANGFIVEARLPLAGGQPRE